MERHEPSQRHRLAIRRVEVHRRGQDGDIASLHRRGERPGPSADVDPEPENGVGGFSDLEELRDGEIELGLVRRELRFGFVEGEIET